MNNQIIKIDKAEFKYSFIKRKEYGETPIYSLVLKNTKTKSILVFKNILTYSRGWSQGTNRSVYGYYLNLRCYGSVGNGSGIDKPVTPYLTENMKDFISQIISKTHYSKNTIEEYDNLLHEFPPKTKIKTIKDNLIY